MSRAHKISCDKMPFTALAGTSVQTRPEQSFKTSFKYTIRVSNSLEVGSGLGPNSLQVSAVEFTL